MIPEATRLTVSQAKAALRSGAVALRDPETSEAEAVISYAGSWLKLGRVDRAERLATVVHFTTDSLFYRDPKAYHERLMRFGAVVTDTHFFVITE